MTRKAQSAGQPLEALAILPNRALAQPLLKAVASARVFHIAAEAEIYPETAELRNQLRQVRPAVVLLDVSGHLEAASGLIQEASSAPGGAPVIALGLQNDPEVLLRCLRAGAAEFLYPPFTAEAQRAAAQRILRLLGGAAEETPNRARLVVFASAKPGSGASTLAAYTALALGRATGQRVLLADLDLFGGTTRLLFKLAGGPSVTDALSVLENGDLETGARENGGVSIEVSHGFSTGVPAVVAPGVPAGAPGWTRGVAAKQGVDILPAPASPGLEAIDPPRLRRLLESARGSYDWLVVDLPSVFDRLSLRLIPEADQTFLIATPELPSLHLMRKAVSLLGMLGLAADQFHVVVNRSGGRQGLSREAMARILQAPVYASFPSDYQSLYRALSAGESLAACGLARAIDRFSEQLAGVTGTEAASGRAPGNGVRC